ncbi:hypothetical protein R3X26_17900 [Vibrio sp. TH_r3]|uniref:hypothetical protein n=1 Tax=Vibrio sp. TH_r3 TaxID=3082084 RepID=UPI002954C1E4|nr:hypothetical protein [Vibrio sp. TH_r3]MDV7106272.1 hypothetical protein [Vibrio sp. TH_r3]
MTQKTLLQKWIDILDAKGELDPYKSLEILGIIESHYNWEDIQKIYSYFPHAEDILARIKVIFEHSHIQRGIAPKPENLKGKNELIALAEQDIKQRISITQKIIDEIGEGQEVLEQLQNISVEYINDFKKIKKFLTKEGFNNFDSLFIDYQICRNIIKPTALQSFWGKVSWSPFEWYPLSYHICFPVTTLPELSMDKAVKFWIGGGLGVLHGDKYIITTRTQFSDIRAIEGDREARKLLKQWQEACNDEDIDEIDDFYMLFVLNHSPSDLKKIFTPFKNTTILTKRMQYIIKQGQLIETVHRDKSKRCTKEEFLDLAQKAKECEQAILQEIAVSSEEAKKILEIYQKTNLEYIENFEEFGEMKDIDQIGFVDVCASYLIDNKIEDNEHACDLVDDLMSYVLNHFGLENCMDLAFSTLAKKDVNPIIDFWAYGGEAHFQNGKYYISSKHTFFDA